MNGSPSEEIPTKYFNYFWFQITDGRTTIKAYAINVNIIASEDLFAKSMFEKTLNEFYSSAELIAIDPLIPIEIFNINAHIVAIKIGSLK